MPDHLEYMWESAFEPSNIGKQIFAKTYSDSTAFLKSGTDYFCFSEGKETIMPLVNRKYFTVEPDLACIEQEKCHRLPLNHVQMSRLNSANSPVYMKIAQMVQSELE